MPRQAAQRAAYKANQVQTESRMSKPTLYDMTYSKIGLKREVSLLFNEGENFLQRPACYTS